MALQIKAENKKELKEKEGKVNNYKG